MENDTGWQSQYGGYAPGEQPDQQTCLHKFVTGADGRPYCEKCGAVLRSTAYDPYRSPRDPRPSESKHWGWIVLVAVVVLAVAGFLGWRFVSRTPAPVASADNAQTLDIGAEPVQTAVDTNLVISQRSDGMKFLALASYRIDAKVLGVRAWASYDKASTGFPMDLALAWGDVARSDYNKYVAFRFTNEYAANQWLMYQYRPGASPPWTSDYLSSHVSNNHVCPASENLYNAIKSLKKGEEVLLEGYLARSVAANGQCMMNSSMRRNDTDAGACEAFFVQKLQVGNKVYK